MDYYEYITSDYFTKTINNSIQKQLLYFSLFAKKL